MTDTGEEGADVAVHVHTEEAPEETGDTPAVVIVEDNGDSDTPSLVALAATVGRLEAEIAELRRTGEETEETAERAEDIAEYAADSAARAEADAFIAEEVAEEAAEEVAEEATEEAPQDTPPHRPHWVHRPMREWFGGND